MVVAFLDKVLEQIFWKSRSGKESTTITNEPHAETYVPVQNRSPVSRHFALSFPASRTEAAMSSISGSNL